MTEALKKFAPYILITLIAVAFVPINYLILKWCGQNLSFGWQVSFSALNTVIATRIIMKSLNKGDNQHDTCT
jgi:hypothetical protein